MPRVSVIVPNYNHARYLPRRIESVLDQTFTDFELIVLDDASPDDSREVIERYTGDARVRTIFNEVNSGNTFRQWDKGLAASSGDYVWIAESDDVADPAFLERMVAALDEHPSAALATCNAIIIDENDTPGGRYYDRWRADGVSDYDLSVFDGDFAMEGAEFVRRLMTPWGSIPNASGVLFRRNALTTIDWPGDDLKLCGDWLVYVRLLKKGDIVHIAQPMNYYRIHAVSVSRRYTGFQFIQQSMIVQREMAQQVGLPIDEILRRIGPRYADIIVGDLSAGTAVAPLAQWPLAIRRGWQVAGSIAAGVAVRLIRQRARAFRRWLPR